MRKHKVAVYQIACGPDSWPDENADKIKSHLIQAADNGASLALFPELSLSGYAWGHENVFMRFCCASFSGIVIIFLIACLTVLFGLLD